MRRLAAGLASSALGALAILGAPSVVLGCSGAPAVTAMDLQHHTGTIAVVRVVDRFGQAGRPRGIVVALEDVLRGRADPLIRLERPRQALGICHDMFTVRVERHLLVAFDVQPLSGGRSLSPAWILEDDGTLGAIYDDPPWPTIAAARAALGTDLPREIEREFGGDIAIALAAIGGGVLLLALVALAGVARRPRAHPA